MSLLKKLLWTPEFSVADMAIVVSLAIINPIWYISLGVIVIWAIVSVIASVFCL